MTDFLKAGLVYVPAYWIGMVLSHYADPFICGWLAGCVAVIIRWQIKAQAS